MKRIKFPCPYRVKLGSAVMDLTAREVGVVIGVSDKPEEDAAGNSIFWIEADVSDATSGDQCQVMEPTFPVSYSIGAPDPHSK